MHSSRFYCLDCVCHLESKQLMKHLSVYTELQEASNVYVTDTSGMSTPPHSWVTFASSFSLPRRGSIPSEVGGQLCKMQDWDWDKHTIHDCSIRSGGNWERQRHVSKKQRLKNHFNTCDKNNPPWPSIENLADKIFVK